MDDITPEELEMLIALGVIPDQQAQLGRQMDYADELRKTPIPTGGMAGRVYVADPFGAMAAGYDRYKGHKEMNALEAQQADLLKQQTAGRKLYADMLRNRLNAQTQPAGAQSNGVTTFPVQ